MSKGHLVRPDGTINTAKQTAGENARHDPRPRYNPKDQVNAYKPAQAQHTPGPWEVSKIGNNYDQYSIYAGDTLVANSVEGEANARLIAAAPELLEALAYAVNSEYDRDEESRNFEADTLERWEQIIAKAEGRDVA